MAASPAWVRAGGVIRLPAGMAWAWGDNVTAITISETGRPVTLPMPGKYPPGAPHPDAFLAARGWKMGASGVWVGISGGIVGPK